MGKKEHGPKQVVNARMVHTGFNKVHTGFNKLHLLPQGLFGDRIRFVVPPLVCGKGDKGDKGDRGDKGDSEKRETVNNVKNATVSIFHRLVKNVKQ